MIHLSIKEEEGLFKVMATKSSKLKEYKDETKLVSIKEARDDAEDLILGLLKMGKADTADVGYLLVL